SGTVPAICTPTGSGSSPWSMRRSDFSVRQKRGSLVVISDIARPAPSRLHSSRNGLSVTPAIGARITLGVLVWGPMCMAPIVPVADDLARVGAASAASSWAGSASDAESSRLQPRPQDALCVEAGFDLFAARHRQRLTLALGRQRGIARGESQAPGEGGVGSIGDCR